MGNSPNPHSVERLSERDHAILSAWWDQQERACCIRAFEAAGFEVAFSCLGWTQMRREYPDMAETLGQSIISRYGMRG